MIPKIGPNVAWQIVDGEAIVVDLASGTTIGLNPAGTLLWSRIDGDRNLDALAAELAASFAVPEPIAHDHTEEFLREMSRRTVIIDAEAIP